jgi:hypothetical protein
MGDDKTPKQLRTHSTIKMTLQFERKYSTQGSGAPCYVSFGFFSGFCEIILEGFQIDPQLESTIRPKARGYISYGKCDSSRLLKDQLEYLPASGCLKYS